MSTKLYTRADLWELAQKATDAMEAELEKLMKISDPGARLMKAENGLYHRLMKATEWLWMMQRCVVSEDAVIKLKDSVAVALYDAFIL